MATVRADGAPVTVPCWYLYEEGGRVMLNSSATARRVEHMRLNPHVALTILGDDWYTHVSFLAHVVEQRPDTGLVDLDRLSAHYLGIPYPDRVEGLTTVVEADQFHTYGSGFVL
jgi:Pyridoxamine 5'-phosphate oxidase